MTNGIPGRRVTLPDAGHRTVVAWPGNPVVRIVFVCTGNTGRSVTAAALAAAVIARDGLNAAVTSRATRLNPDDCCPEAPFVALLAARGIDTSGHRATQFGPRDAEASDLILTMTAAHTAWVVTRFPKAAAKVHSLSAYVLGTQADIADAHGRPMDVYRTVLAQLDALVEPAVTKAVRAVGTAPDDLKAWLAKVPDVPALPGDAKD